jgi:arylsulfatase A-like enzyme
MFVRASTPGEHHRPADRSMSLSTSALTAPRERRLRPWDVIVLSAWCGLAGGLLEVAVRVLSRYIDPVHRLYLLSRHFVWLAPLSNLLLFLVTGLLLAIGTWLWPRRSAWFVIRFLGFLTVLPALVVTSPRIYPAAWAVLALGISSIASWCVEQRASGLRRLLLVTFPALLGCVLILAVLVVGTDRLNEWRENTRALPPADAPNVLLVVLDTVRADHLSLYGYERPTSPALERLARRGIRFDNARAAAPWTMPSHASFFSGRAPHELGVEWQTPIPNRFPTLAEYLGSQGYNTAGFVANTPYCSSETGLNRGFTHYDDYVLEGLIPLRTAWLSEHALQLILDCGVFVGRSFNVGPFRPMHESWIASLFIVDRRKSAVLIHQQFVDWLARRGQPERPFFAFLNFYDAHAPYVLPQGAGYRFGLQPRRVSDFMFLMEYWDSLDRRTLAPAYRRLALDSYDNCVAYLDEQLGALFDDLQKRGLLDTTLVVVTADHGEGLGEHDLFDHGESLYRNEIRVPLLIVPPANQRRQGVVTDTVSLRDLPATIADLTGLGAEAPFPGRSLAPLWHERTASAVTIATEGALSELASPNPFNPNQGRSPAHRGPLVSLAAEGFVYIRNQRDGTEEFYNERDDPGDQRNLSRDAATQPVLKRFRERASAMTAPAP